METQTSNMSTKQQLRNILTKPLEKERFSKLRLDLGLLPFPFSTWFQFQFEKLCFEYRFVLIIFNGLIAFSLVFFWFTPRGSH